VPCAKLDTMGTILPITYFSQIGRPLMAGLLVLACLAGLSGAVNLCRDRPVWQRAAGLLLPLTCLVFLAGFIWICWFHYQIYHLLPLELPAAVHEWLNRQLANAAGPAGHSLPLYNPAQPPRYTIPVWIENEKYYFWFMCYAGMAYLGGRRQRHHRFLAVLHLLLAVQVVILFAVADPFARPLPQFSAEVGPWLAAGERHAAAQVGLFMQLYPRMIFYYNAHYMWLHPPLLFLAYASITIVFVVSGFMLVRREPELERLGYDFAKFGYLLLTIGMLLGYPWALQAWGPNWWWDPKICSSLMMWAVFTTYLHTRLYANKPAMWYFSAILGIVCFLAMLFTFLTSFYFPGEHTFQ